MRVEIKSCTDEPCGDGNMPQALLFRPEGVEPWGLPIGSLFWNCTLDGGIARKKEKMNSY
jgi:hypothetical protein